MKTNDPNSELFQQSLKDYFYLIDRGYPEKGSLKLTGDRYKLSTDLRNLLYRGVTSHENSKQRSDRLVDTPHELLIIDGYNVLFTLLNYRLGRMVFISADNICRDNGSLYGKIKDEKLFTECACLMTSYLKKLPVTEVIIYLDEPVSFSRDHQRIISHELKKQKITNKTEVLRSADQAILLHASGIIASSDSSILDRSELPLFDLPRKILETEFHAELYNLYEYFKEKI